MSTRVVTSAPPLPAAGAPPLPAAGAPAAGDPARSGEPGRVFTRAERIELWAELLLRYPDATVCAIADSGRFVPMPDDVPIAGHPVIDGHDSALELVAADDIVAVIEAWKTAGTSGVGVTEVRPLDQPAGRLALYFVDLRDEHGVLLGMIVGADRTLSGARGAGNLLRPRLSVVRKTRLAEFERVDPAFQIILGYPPDEMVGRRSLDLVHPDDQPRAIANWIDMLGEAGTARRVRLRHRHADGHWVWFELTNHNNLTDPELGCVVTEMLDISDEMRALENLRASQRLLARLTDALPVGVVQVDRERRVVYRNVRAGEILGSEGTGTLDELLDGVLPDDRDALSRAGAVVLAGGSDTDLEVGLERPDGRHVRCRLSLRPLTDDDGVITGAIACIDDITEPARLRAQLELRATYDSLTGCLNRAAVLVELERALEEARTHDTGVAVVFVDLDGFKSVNDTRGHTAGDALLQDIGRHLLAAARREDVVGRVGGDEFLLVGRDVRSADQALTLGQRLADALAADITPQYPYRAVASIGVAWAGSSWCPWLSADDLVAQADRAMYNSKREGSGRPVLG